MKKALFTLALLLVSTMSFAQSVNDIIDDFKEKKGVEYVHIPKMMMKMAMSHVKESKANDLLKEIESVQILSMEECSKKQKKAISKRVDELKNYGFDEMVRVKDNGDNVLIITKMTGEDITELVLLTLDTDDCSMIYVTGKIKKEAIDDIINMNK